MQTIILETPGRFVLADHPIPGAPGPSEALVRVHRVAVCGTDIHAYHGRQPFFTYPRILGHELGVEVLAVGDGVSHLGIGERCAVEPYLASPGDIAFRRGKTNCSASTECLGVHRDGGMREQFILPADNLHPARSLDYEQLALVETLAIGRHATERANPLPDEHVAVIGLGPIGLAVTQFLVLRGLQVTVVDLSAERLAFAQRLYPSVATLERDPATSLASCWDAMGDARPETVFDVTGNRRSMEAALDLATNGGRVVFVGLVKDPITFDDPSFHRRELTLLSSRNALPSDFSAIIRGMEAGLIDVRPWFTHRCVAHELPEAFPQWLAHGSGLLKGVVDFSS